MSLIKSLREFGFKTSNRTYVIAEIGINHGGNLDTAKRLVDAAARTGVDAVKFQTYLTEKRAPKGNQVVFDILKRCELPFEDFGKLQEHARLQNVDFFSTPFDPESVAYLQSINCDLYKIASFDVVNLALLREVASTGKPVIMSVGMATREEIDTARQLLKKDEGHLVLMHCVSSYPLREENANLAAIYSLQELYEDCVIGYSDHTSGVDVPLMAVAAGAQVIEKHFKIDEDMDCVDSSVSITETQAREMMVAIRRIETVFGSGELGVREAEKAITAFRRPSK
jgi:N,N'-diacetyllegionaminate synthase